MLGLLAICGTAAVLRRVRGGDRALPAAVVLALVLCMIVVFQMRWAESLTQMRMVLENLDSSYGIRESAPLGQRMSEIITHYPVVVHVSEVVLSLAAPLLTLIAAGASGLFRKEPFPIALSRSLKRGALVFTTLLSALYALMLIVTAHAEAQANAVLDARTQNGIAYLRSQVQSGPRP